MSAEIITTVVSAAALLVGMIGTMAAGMSWLVRRIDRVEERLVRRVDRVEERLGARIDRVESDLGARIGGLQHELGEVKIAVARLEGPERRLIAAR